MIQLLMLCLMIIRMDEYIKAAMHVLASVLIALKVIN